MQQSSESIGAIAAALAKAQLELTNPEKSLSATVVSPFPREEARTFRYAPLSSGLEIVRKCLGKHEIAAVQTTSIDKESGLIRLTTTLAHSSGEWMASEWPVCPVSETSAPHRLGAALTYARRHSLFTLVGIAGDDDRDAPDLGSETSEASETTSHVRNGESESDDAPSGVTPRRSASSRKSPPETKPPRFAQRRPMFSADQSAITRDRLLADLDGITGADELADWAKQAIPVKNDLGESDAAIIEAAFTAKTADLASEVSPSCVPILQSPSTDRVFEEPPCTAGPEAIGETPRRTPSSFTCTSRSMPRRAAVSSRKVIISRNFHIVSMCRSGNGGLPGAKAFCAKCSMAPESLPME